MSVLQDMFRWNYGIQVAYATQRRLVFSVRLFLNATSARK